jgi:hypothetical protein
MNLISFFKVVQLTWLFRFLGSIGDVSTIRYTCLDTFLSRVFSAGL